MINVPDGVFPLIPDNPLLFLNKHYYTWKVTPAGLKIIYQENSTNLIIQE